jgi:hypothetical protein
LAGKTQSTLVLPNVQPTNAGPYWVRVRNSAGRAVNSRLVWLTVQPVAATVTPIPLSGWNENVVVTDKTVGLSTPFDGGSSWYAAGVLGSLDPGLPAERRFGSRVNTNVVFELQPYDANNALYLINAVRGPGSAQSFVQQTKTLTLTAPTRYGDFGSLADRLSGSFGGPRV